MSTEIIMVSGLASKGANLAPLKYISEYLADGNVHYVDGAYISEFDKLEVSPPSRQIDEVAEIVTVRPNAHFTIISHSMGALAALYCVENFHNVAAISIAPPLLYPISTLYDPRLLGRLKINENGIALPSYSFALGDRGPSNVLPAPTEINFPQSIFDEIAGLSDTYMERTRKAIHRNSLRIIIPSQDWNISALQSAAYLDRVTFLPAPHSLQTDQDTLEQNAQAILSLAKEFRLRA